MCAVPPPTPCQCDRTYTRAHHATTNDTTLLHTHLSTFAFDLIQYFTYGVRACHRCVSFCALTAVIAAMTAAVTAAAALVSNRDRTQRLRMVVRVRRHVRVRATVCVYSVWACDPGARPCVRVSPRVHACCRDSVRAGCNVDVSQYLHPLRVLVRDLIIALSENPSPTLFA